MKHSSDFSRRKFLQTSALFAIGSGGFLPLSAMSNNTPPPDLINVVGPKEGYTPQIGTLVSMLNWMRNTILRPVQGMSTKDLDFLLDDNANSIGAMLLHLAATERFYQIHTFEGKNWGDWSKEDDKAWSTAMGLGDEGRAKIKGKPLDFYLEKLSSVREHTLKEFAKRDDAWLLAVDEDWYWGPTNNYCKWFHVCEHESNHNGQIKMVRSRIS
ncbi:MAG: DUF664 domain-containing protein [Bacteroidota bacterium]